MLRKSLTEAEKKLWWELRDFKRRGFHFRRQVPIGKYIADFACLKEKLIVELDGGHHTSSGQLSHDQRRDQWLRGEEFEVLRFFNDQVFKDKEAVLNAILQALPLEGGGGRRARSDAAGGGDQS